MSKQIVRTGDVAGFFDRARTAARKADQGGKFAGSVTLSIEDPQRMFTVPVVSPKLDRMKKIFLRSK